MTSVRETIRKVLARHDAANMSDLEVAERVLEYGDEYDWRDAALELLPDAVWAVRRQEARKRERSEAERMRKREQQRQRELDAKAQAEGFEDYESKRQHEDAEFDRRMLVLRDRHLAELFAIQSEYMAPYEAAKEFTDAFLNSEFAIGDGRRVTWGDATKDDHIARIEFMRTRIEGMEDDVILHMQVVEVLDTLGAETLRKAKTLAPAA